MDSPGGGVHGVAGSSIVPNFVQGSAPMASVFVLDKRVLQSVGYPMFSEVLSLEDFSRILADIGYQGMELWEPPPAIVLPYLVSTIAKHGLRLVGMEGTTRGLNDRHCLSRVEAELRGNIELAATHGVRHLTLHAGLTIPEQTEDESIDNCVVALKRIAPHARDRGVLLVLENLNPLDNPLQDGQSVAYVANVCQGVSDPHVKMLLDIYSAQITDGNIIETIRRHIGSIGHFQVAGVPGRGEADEWQELNYSAICRLIASLGYEGFVGQEFKPGPDPEGSLRRMFAICDHELCRPSGRPLERP